jgi:hypothetical protein
VGWSDVWTVVDTGVVGDRRVFVDERTAAVYGVDLNLTWEPTGRMRYRNIQWRSEGYYVDKEIYAPDGSGVDKLNPWGFYSLVQIKVSRTLEVGARYDHYAPHTKNYASIDENLSLSPLAVTASDAYRRATSAWLTWWQSPFVKFRGGYSYENGKEMGPDVHAVTLQMVFAAGPHKHERY